MKLNRVDVALTVDPKLRGRAAALSFDELRDETVHARLDVARLEPSMGGTLYAAGFGGLALIMSAASVFALQAETLLVRWVYAAASIALLLLAAFVYGAVLRNFKTRYTKHQVALRWSLVLDQETASRARSRWSWLTSKQ